MVWEAVGRLEEDQALKDLQRCVNPHEAELEIEDSMGRSPLFVSAAQDHPEVGAFVHFSLPFHRPPPAAALLPTTPAATMKPLLATGVQNVT